jgi:hypothetical protein
VIHLLGGIALFVLAGLLLLGAFSFGRISGRATKQLANPVYALRTVTFRDGDVAKVIVDLTGTLVSEATLTGPLTGRPCLAWQIMLLRKVMTEDPVKLIHVWTWSDGRNGDLTIRYNERQEGHAGHDGHKLRVERVVGPGRFTIPAGMIRMVRHQHGEMSLRHSVEVPIGSVDLAALGVPAELVEAVAANPDGYVIDERTAETGDFFRVRRGPVPLAGTEPGQAGQYLYVSGPQEFGTSQAGSALMLMFGVLAVVACGLGYAVIR